MLVGDVNLSEVQARECVQDCAPPISGLPIQRAGGGLDQWHVSSTAAGLSGDVMFTAGAAVKTTVVPIGKSFGYNAVRKDEHDTVSASLLVPCWAVKTGDAPQVAEAQEPPGDSADDAEVGFLGNWDFDVTNPGEASEARDLDEEMRGQQDEAWDESPATAEQLGRILFK